MSGRERDGLSRAFDRLPRWLDESRVFGIAVYVLWLGAALAANLWVWLVRSGRRIGVIGIVSLATLAPVSSPAESASPDEWTSVRINYSPPVFTFIHGAESISLTLSCYQRMQAAMREMDAALTHGAAAEYVGPTIWKFVRKPEAVIDLAAWKSVMKDCTEGQ